MLLLLLKLYSLELLNCHCYYFNEELLVIEPEALRVIMAKLQFANLVTVNSP